VDPVQAATRLDQAAVLVPAASVGLVPVVALAVQVGLVAAVLAAVQVPVVDPAASVGLLVARSVVAVVTSTSFSRSISF
jgi:hypothetical protein